MANKGPHVLIDLERTIGTGQTHFWRSGCMGYTTRHGEAGQYDEAEARRLTVCDLDKTTIAMPVSKFENILHKYGELK